MADSVPKSYPNVLIFHRPSGYGGAEAYLKTLVAALLKSEYKVTICFGHGYVIPLDFKETLKDHGAVIFEVGFDLTYKSSIFDLPRIINYLNKINPDIVLFCRFGYWIEYRHVLISLWLKNIPNIVIDHNTLDPCPVPPPRRYPPKNLHLKYLYETAYRYLLSRIINTVVCMNNLERKKLIDYYHISEDKAQVIYNGVEIDRFTFNNSERIKKIQELEIPKNKIIVLTIGRHSHEKGIDILLNAISLLSVEDKNKSVFIIAGEGTEHNALKKQALELGLADYVRFLGFRTDVPELLWASDIFVLSSRKETFGISVAEAMAASRCVIATAVGGVPELVGDAGILISPESAEAMSFALANAINNKELRVKIGLKALQRIKESFSIDSTIGNTLKLILNTLGQ